MKPPFGKRDPALYRSPRTIWMRERDNETPWALAVFVVTLLGCVAVIWGMAF